MVDFYVNPNKRLEIDVDNKTYLRHAVKTHFIKPQEDYIELIKSYVSPIYETGDILFLGEKIISLCQNRICYAKDIMISKWAKFLSGFASSNNHGIGVDNPYKMQLAINFAGLPRVILAAICSGICRLFGIRGVFYSIVGKGVSGIDGFYGKAFEFYSDKGILLPDNCDGVCNEIELNLGIKCVIVDANDLGVEILGKSMGVEYSDRQLKSMIRDNPAGQSTQLTPMILAREQEPDQNLQEATSTV
jgi:F420-0:gamma-glutamyl ligase-like protein